MPVDLQQLANLLARLNQTMGEIAALIGRPAAIGHIGESIAAAIFDIELNPSAAHRGSDGHFRTGALAGRTVNIKFYSAHQGLLDINPESVPDFFLVLTGPRVAAASSRNAHRPLGIDRVFLFAGPTIVTTARSYGVKVGVATSIRTIEWQNAEIFPEHRSSDLDLTADQHASLMLFRHATP